MDCRVMLILFLTLYWKLQISLGQICKFYHLKADCRYRIDGISMVHIQATINQCNDPVDVTFRLRCGNPEIDWKYTFVNSNELKDIPGFDDEIGLQVKQGFIKDHTYVVEADFHVENSPRADFINEQIDLYPDNCITINDGAKIAIGVLVSLVIIASIALVIVLFIRWRRKNELLQNPDLVTNAAPPGQSNPPVVYYKNQTDNLQITDPGNSNGMVADGTDSTVVTVVGTTVNGTSMTGSAHSMTHERY